MTFRLLLFVSHGKFKLEISSESIKAARPHQKFYIYKFFDSTRVNFLVNLLD